MMADVDAIITVRVAASAQVHAARDAAVAACVDARTFDLFSFPQAVTELEAKASDGQRRAVGVARKAGLVPSGRPDLSYGFYGNHEGPISYWYQIKAEA